MKPTEDHLEFNEYIFENSHSFEVEEIFTSF